VTTNILVLAAGQVVSDEQGNGYPICLAELDGISIIERIVRNTRAIPDAKYAFALLNQDAERFHLDRVVTLLVPDAEVTRIPESTRGSACTALLAACKLQQDAELLVVSANELVDIDLSQVVKDFQLRELDGGTLTFRSIHPRYSYVRLNAEGLVVEAAQQKPISQNATAGVFWFKKTSDFVAAVQAIIRKNAVVANKFFVAPAFNELILLQKRVGVFELEISRYRPLKTEQQVQHFEKGP
jgi:hypothetical protein